MRARKRRLCSRSARRRRCLRCARSASSASFAVADVVADAARKLAAEYGAEVRSVDDILADSTIDAVLIATSTDTHAGLIERAAAAGKAVLCEKPVDLSLERAQACEASVNGTGATVMIGFNRRFDSNFSALKAALDAGEIGKAELLTITSFDPAPPPLSYIEVSGGLYRDMMIHDFDTACWLMGGAPARIFASGASLVDPRIGSAGDVDTAVATLSWADGRVAVIKNSRRAGYGYDQRVELLGSGGLLAAQNLLENTVERISDAGTFSAKPVYFFLERYRRAYEAEWSAFVDAVREGSRAAVTLADGVLALACAEAAARSARSGKTEAIAPDLRGA
ncbi:inositol 2-dehydrogenase [Paraburkholderia sp. NMBU_R16]|uniref:inositol 2-dehydrogenase n=1 Tax=Paraburkholderia sp. NMBU_R16 TaxID=2698676 RepID=UPI0020B8A39D|nr:inositol 2-dehydrogenase [Paraburkholderia sp. NMBU_R16]